MNRHLKATLLTLLVLLIPPVVLGTLLALAILLGPYALIAVFGVIMLVLVYRDILGKLPCNTSSMTRLLTGSSSLPLGTGPSRWVVHSLP